jgi:hypothetical protein
MSNALFVLLSTIPLLQSAETVLLKRVEVIRVNTEDVVRLPVSLHSIFAGPIPDSATPMNNLDEAKRRAGFTPLLPVSAKPPDLMVIDPIRTEVKIRADDLTAALAQAKVANVAVPRAWDGVTINVQQSRGVLADYGGFFLAQGPPLTLNGPPGFPLDQLFEVLFRIVGINASEARTLRQKFAANPAAYFPIPSRYDMDIREVRLNAGTGLLLQNADKGGELALMWSSADRSYFLTGLMPEAEAIAMANSLQ